MSRRYWIGVASFNHVKLGIDGGFSQLCHGKAAPLKRMKENDVIIYYSPTQKLGEKDRFQSFSAIGRVVDNKVYQFAMSDDFIPYRRNVEFYKEVKPANIHALINQLEFIEEPKHYGAKFRFGHLEISKKDAMTIWHAMKI